MAWIRFHYLGIIHVVLFFKTLKADVQINQHSALWFISEEQRKM